MNASGTQNHKAQLANAYNELGKELSSSKIRVIGNYTLGKAIGEGMLYYLIKLESLIRLFLTQEPLERCEWALIA